jgi:L,D-transpeptidase catalytic domain
VTATETPSATPTETETPSATPEPEHWVDVNRSNQLVTLYEGDKPIAAFPASFGFDPSDSGYYATAIGTYYVYQMYAGLNWTDWGQAWIRDWIGFDPERQNGFHSYSMDASGNVLPDGDGPTGGCVALAPAAADQLFAFVGVGTRVVVHR